MENYPNIDIKIADMILCEFDIYLNYILPYIEYLL